MVGQLVVEDEYTINVKLRRPLSEGSCLPPPTITITPDDPIITLLPPPNTTLTHAQAAKSVNGAPPVVVGCSTSLHKPSGNEVLLWQGSKEYECYRNLGTYRRAIMPPPAPPPPPPVRRTYQEDYVPEDKVTVGCLRLPLVQVFSDDNSLVATNKFSAPSAPSSLSLSPAGCSTDASHALASSLQKVQHPSAPGSLYIERIPAHCRSESGVLYVPPVDERCLRRNKWDEPPVKGNSRRNKPKGDEVTTQGQDAWEVKATEVNNCVSAPPLRTPPEGIPPRSSSSKAAARALLAEVLSPRIEKRFDQRPPSPRPQRNARFNFNNNNTRGRYSRNIPVACVKNDDEVIVNNNKKSTAVVNFSVSQENKKNASLRKNNITAVSRHSTSLNGIDTISRNDNSHKFVADNSNQIDNDYFDVIDSNISSPTEGERVVEVYGGVAAHAHTAAHTHTSQPVGGSGRSGHGDPARPQPVDPALLTSLDLESDNHSHDMLVTDSPHPAHSRHPHDLNHNNQVFSQKPSEEINHVSGRAAKYMVSDASNIGLENFGFNHELGGQDNYGYDPGYSSERSPEDEEGPPLYYRKAQKERENRAIESSSGQDRQSLRFGPGEEVTSKELMKLFPFISEGTIFEVTVIKNLRGLGLALTGGVECDLPFAGLLRIKKLYPQTPAWLCGQLQIGDIVLRANSHQLTGLSSHEALELLRTSGQEVTLEVCRPPPGTLGDGEDTPDGGSGPVIVSTSLTAPNTSQNYLSPSPSFSSCGEFEVVLTKVAGSLGFTLCKQDNSILGHTIRTLVKEPAISDGRLRPGDKIISVNNTDMCSLSHEEAIAFLRTCPETVTLKLYRDAMQTPVSPISPTEPEIMVKPKALRKEARDMLTDLAFRKQSPSNSPSLAGATSSPGTPRRRRLQKTPSPDIKTVVADRWDSLVRRSEESQPGSPTLENRSSLNSIRETNHESSPFGDSLTDDSGSTTIRSRNSSVSSCSLTASTSESSRPKRPSFLDLSSGRSCPRKTQFTPPHEVDQSFPSPLGVQYPSADSLDSAPQLTSTHSDTPAFAHLQQGYHSVNLGALHPHEDSRLTNTTSDHNISGHDADGLQNNGLLKWKGIVFTPEEEDSNSEESLREDSSLNSQQSHKPKVVTIELNRGWNSRLGFSLQPEGETTIITAIYADSVAAKDGRLRIGDIVVKVNDVDVVGWDTESIIDLLRKTRGKISLSVTQHPC